MTDIRGDRVLIERRRIGMTQSALAASAGVARSYISQIENNRDVDVTVRVLYAIAEALGVSPLYLLGETENPLLGVADLEEESVAASGSSAEPVSEHSDLLRAAGRLSKRGRSLLLVIADAIHDFENQWNVYQGATATLEAQVGADAVEAMNRQLASRAAALGSMEAAVAEFRANYGSGAGSAS